MNRYYTVYTNTYKCRFGESAMGVKWEYERERDGIYVHTVTVSEQGAATFERAMHTHPAIISYWDITDDEL